MDTAASYAALQRHVLSVSPLTDEELKALFAQTQLIKYEPGEAFVRVGKHSEVIGVVLSGLFRVYYLTESGVQLVRRFIPEGRIVGDLAPQLTGQQARVTIDALETSVVAVMRYRMMEQLFDRHPGWQRFGRKLMERYYLILEEREYQFLAYSAAERYRLFRQEYAGLEERVSQANIASYLGINPVTLSRIRSSKASKNP